MNVATRSNLSISSVRITKLQSLSQGISLAVAFVGALGIIGWIFNIAGFKSIVPGMTPIKVNTAVCFIFTGISLWLWHQRAAIAPARSIAQGLTALVSLISLLTLAEYWLNVDLGIDQLLIRVPVEATAPTPGRMALHTTLNFLLVSLALFLLHRRKPQYLFVQGLTCFVSLSAFFALLSYFYGNAILYSVGALTLFSFNATLNFLLLSLGLFLVRPDRGVVAVFAEETLGGMLARRLFPAAILVPTLICWLSLLGQRRQIYTSELGICLLSLANMMIFSALVWVTARILGRLDRQRQRAEQALQYVAIDLERQVERRTASLQVANAQLQVEISTSQTAQQERQQAEEMLHQSEQRFRALFEQAPFGVICFSSEGYAIQVNLAWEEIWELSLEAIAGYNILQDPQLKKMGHMAEIQRAFTGATVALPAIFYDPTVIGLSGRSRWIEIALYSIKNEAGAVQEIVLVSNDVTGRKQAEDALQQLMATLEQQVAERTAELVQSNNLLQRELITNKLTKIALQEREELFRTVVDVLAEGVTVQEGNGIVVASNASAERILGLSPQQMTGLLAIDPCWQMIHPNGSPASREEHPAVISLQTGEPCSNVILGIHKPDGSLTWISINTQPLTRANEPLPYAIVTSFSDITDLKLAENALHESEAELRALFATLTDVIVVRNAQGRCLKIAPTNPINLYKPTAEMLGKTLHESLPTVQADYIQACIQQALSEQQPIPGEYSLTLHEREVHFSATFSPISPNAVVIVARDITARKQAEAALFHEKELAQVTLQSIGDAVITTDALGQVHYLNPVAENLTGWSQSEAQGLPLREVFNIINETTRLPVSNPIEEALREGRIVGLANHTILIARDGNEFPIDDSAAPIRASDGEVIGAVLVFHDVTHTRSLTHQLSWQATHDALTGLVNRREFESRLNHSVHFAKLENQSHALCYLDLDQFKIVNDTCGHAAGDELLRQVTALLQAQIRKTDTLARLGGDEFGVLLNQCPLEQAQKVANTLREQIHGFRFIWNDKQFAIGVSIGLVVIDFYSEDTARVLSAADAACYAAKNKGRNRVHVYQANDLELVQQQGEMQWVTRLNQALEEDRFCLYYQTIVPTIAEPFTGEHYEVLLRLQDESGKLVPPMAFIPAAERYNLMHKIDRWVIRTLFATQSQHYRDVWSRCHTQNCDCSYLYAVNLSGASINDDKFIDFLHAQFELHQIPPQLICFEITETVAISNLAKAAQFIDALRELGCRFALDDFGSGMSSFGYLKNLPIDYLKIDGSFIKHIVEDPIDSVIVEAIKQVGQAMGIQTIAEFVENDEILDKVRMLGVNYAQGYGIATPCAFAPRK